MSKQIADFQDTIAELEAKIEVLTREKYWATRKCAELEARIARMKAAGDGMRNELNAHNAWDEYYRGQVAWANATENP
jgi:hypothetical protein